MEMRIARPGTLPFAGVFGNLRWPSRPVCRSRPSMIPRAVLRALLVCRAWAGNFLTSGLALRETPALRFSGLRLALLALLLLALLRRPAPGQWPRLLAT